MWYFHYYFLILLWFYGVLWDSIQTFELFYSCEKCPWKFYRDFINLYIAFGSMDNLTLIIPISWAQNIIFVSHRRSKHVWTKAEFIIFPTKPGSTSIFSSLVTDPSIHQWHRLEAIVFLNSLHYFTSVSVQHVPNCAKT